MIRGEFIICISSIDWEFNWQGHQEIMSAFAEQGNVVLFIENTGIRVPTWRDAPRLWRRVANWRRHVGGIRQVQERLYVCSPVILPFPYSRLAGLLNQFLLYRTVRTWSRLVGSTRPMVWTFLPTRTALDVMDALDPSLIVYYCIADFEELGPVHKVRRGERQLLQRADVVFAQGEFLARRCRRHHPDVAIFPFGVQPALFSQTAEPPMPDELRRIARPRIGYVGALQRHVDIPLLAALAQRRPEWSLVFVGPQDEPADGLRGARNVFWLGSQPHERIPGYIAHFDVCLIPYRLNRYTQTVYPTKLHEYLMGGKPVVSTALPEVLPFGQGVEPLVRIAETVDQFEASVAEALREQNPALAQRRREAARAHAWPARIEAMSRILEARLAAKRQEATSQWSRLLQRVVQTARRRALAWAAGTACVYLLVFHTPLLWLAAGPLHLAQPPRPADAIVVFAGGVGESGHAGQGYEERVAHAVSLYQQGYAPRLIFSSGYRYALNETDVMKALAVSLGVPPAAILLEQQAGNTYENVRLSAALLRQTGCRSALVVSSPYHMRRVALVWRKAAPDLTVVWSPIPYSHFFGDHRTVQLRHLQAIAHEYLGLLYYAWQRWI